MAQILVIEDNTTMREGIHQVLEFMDHDVFAAPNGKEGLAYFTTAHPDLVITDLKMDEVDGMEVLRAIKEQAPHTLVIMITAFGTIELAVEAMQLGAFDFITKPFPPELLRIKVKKALDVAKTRAENRYLRKEQMKKSATMLIGSAPSIVKIQHQLQKAAPTDASILISGENGTGKDLIARNIHQLSYRQQKPFIKVDCSLHQQSILEIELFGHERGAFQGAQKRKIGHIELADQGTIFLDEIGEVSPEIQTKLLRILQERKFERVGADKAINIDVRIISATSRDLQKLVQEGTFREDLYYLLNVVPIPIPALRDRTPDIPTLTEFFIEKQRNKLNKDLQIGSDTMLLLQQYSWPGNIRELQNIVERMCILAEEGLIQPSHLPTEIKNEQTVTPKDQNTSEKPLQEQVEALEKSLIIQALENNSGVKSKAAQQLGLNVSALYYKLEKYDLS